LVIEGLRRDASSKGLSLTCISRVDWTSEVVVWASDRVKIASSWILDDQRGIEGTAACLQERDDDDDERQQNLACGGSASVGCG
jgi:hypothetical protein